MAIYLFDLKMFCFVLGFVLGFLGSVDSYNVNRSSTDLDKAIRDQFGPPVFSKPPYEASQPEISYTRGMQKHESDVNKSMKDIFRPPLVSDYNDNQRRSGTGTEDIFIDPKELENIFGANTNPSMLKTDSSLSASNREKDKTTGINNTGLDLEIIWPGAPPHNHKYDPDVMGGSDDRTRSNPEMQNMVRSTAESLMPPPQLMAGPDDNSKTNGTVPGFDTDNRFLSESLLSKAFGNSLEGVQKRNAIITRNPKELAPTEPGLTPEKKANTEHENHILMLPMSYKDHTLTPLTNQSTNYLSNLILIVIALCIFPHQYN